MFINFYGWQGAAQNASSRENTDAPITAAHHELDTAGNGLEITLGDCHTDAASIPAMRKLIITDGLATLPSPNA